MVHITLLASSLIAFIKHHKKSLIAVSFLLLFVFSALRYGFGNDYFSYLKIFNEVKITGWHDYYSENVLFVLLNKISPTFQVFIAISSFIFLFAVYRLICKNVDAKYHGLSLIIFVFYPYNFLINLSSIRQSLALAVFIFAIYFAIKRKLIPYIALIVVASLFHSSAIILLPIYFVANGKKPSRAFLIGFVIAIALLSFNPVSYDWFINLFNDFLADNRYDRYLESQGNSLQATLVAIMYLTYMVLNIRKLEGKALAYGKLYLISAAIGVLAYKLSIFTRFDIYFSIFALVALPNVIDANVKKERNQFLYFLYVYIFPIAILGTITIKYYNFFSDDLWASFRTYQPNFAGFFR